MAKHKIFYATQQIRLTYSEEQLNRLKQLETRLEKIGSVFVYETPIRIVINDRRRD